jgi:superfamily I DNA/RNA helicase
MNLIRHEKGFSKTESRFPTKGTCLAIYSRCVNAETAIEQVLGASFPWCSGWAAELKKLFAAYVEAKQKQNVLDYDDLLLYWAQTMSDPALADDIGGRFDHVLVDEYQDTNRLQSSILLALKPGGHGQSCESKIPRRFHHHIKRSDRSANCVGATSASPYLTSKKADAPFVRRSTQLKETRMTSIKVAFALAIFSQDQSPGVVQ